MAFLFEVKNGKAFPNVETLLIYPFKDIWERDKTKSKEIAIKELTYIEFLISMKKTNPYRQYPENEKSKIIKENIIRNNKWKPDKLIVDGIEILKDLQSKASTTYNYYLSAKRAAEKMQVFFNNVDITALNPKTFNPIYKPKDITSALNDTAKVLSNLKTLEKNVEEELYNEVKQRSNKTISHFANPDSLK